LYINKLSIRYLRNITQADIALSPTLNFIQGNNGAGKSSILEGIYLLARAKSFRNSHAKSLVQQGQKALTLYTEVKNQTDHTSKIGLRKQGSHTEIRINGDPLKRLSDLVTTLSVSLVTPQSHRIVEEGPEHRRRMLNWGVFHVEHNFRQIASNYNRVLAQRNSALKSHQPFQSPWDEQLCRYAGEINRQHQKYINLWSDIVKGLCTDVECLRSLQITYQQGWDSSSSLSDVLRKKLDLDRTRGFTSNGPHRSDIHIMIGKRPAKEVLSRGQQKLLMIMLLLAQTKLMSQVSGEKSVFLIDDLHSELDKYSQQIALEKISQEFCQAVITTIDGKDESKNNLAENTAMFHVEHGVVDRCR
jgi:DNA replication and repair protein RecF